MKAQHAKLILSMTFISALTLLVTGCNPQQTSTPPTPSSTVGTKFDDSVVTTRVKSTLLADPKIKSVDIAVVTRKGEVQLSGFVDNQAQIDRAIEITRSVEGVESVINKMSIKQ